MSNLITNNSFFKKYTDLVNEPKILDAFIDQKDILQSFCNKISEQKSMYAYALGKWTLKEMLQHIIDTERIFTYRALCIARKEKTILPGYDENDYASYSGANTRTWAYMVDEMTAVRKSTQYLYYSFTEDMLNSEGQFSEATDSVKNIGFIMVGHVYHHIKIAEERYF